MEKTGTTENMFYIHPDYLGSVHLLTNASGSVVQELSYDAWGRQRNATDWTYNGTLPEPKFERGYTFHEQLTEFDLINMNGRIYDPFIARFMSPDPFTQDPGNLQGYNRYSYVLNNPMKYVDPSGYKTYHWEEPVWNYEAVNFAGGGAGSYSDGFNWPKFGTLHGPKNAFEYDLMLAQQVDKEFGISSNTEAVMNDANQGYYPAYQLKKSNLIYHTGKYQVIGSSTTTWEDGTAVVTQDVEPIYAVKATNGGDSWENTALNHGGKTLGGVGLLNKGRELAEWEYLRQARYNRALSGDFSNPIKNSLRGLKNTGRVLGGAGIVLTGVDMGMNGINVSNSLDLVMGGCSLHTSCWLGCFRNIFYCKHSD